MVGSAAVAVTVGVVAAAGGTTVGPAVAGVVVAAGAGAAAGVAPPAAGVGVCKRAIVTIKPSMERIPRDASG